MMPTELTHLEKVKIEMENLGPIEKLTLTAKPGVITVLTGPNGSGKTQALQAIEGLVSGKSRLSSRDGTTGGTILGFGITIKVGRGGANRRSGDLEIKSVEDRLNIADLINPGLKDPFAADARRIKALVTLAGVDANADLFHDLVGGEDKFYKLVKPESIDKPDIVSLAAAVKRDFEAASRNEASAAENLQRDIRAKEEANEGIDIEAPHDSAVLQSALEISLSELAAEKQRAADAIIAIESASVARRSIEKSKLHYKGPTVEVAINMRDGITDKRHSQKEVVEVLKRNLANAESALWSIEHQEDLADETVISAKYHAAVILDWETDVKAAENVDPPDSDVSEKLKIKIGICRLSIENGVRVRDALERIEIIKLLADQMRLASINSARLRDAAHGTEDILSRLVAKMGGPFTVDGEFRLVVQHPKRGKTYFSELSPGEGCAVAFGVVIEAFQRKKIPGLLALPQELWESMDDDNQSIAAESVKGTDLIVFTGQVSQRRHPNIVAVPGWSGERTEDEMIDMDKESERD